MSRLGLLSGSGLAGVWLAGRVPVMGGQVITVRVDDTDLLVETPASRPAGTESTSAADRAADAFGRAQDAILAVSIKVADTIGKLLDRGARPNKVEVEFGLKFTTTGNVIVASGSAEVALKVTVGYDPACEPPTVAAASS